MDSKNMRRFKTFLTEEASKFYDRDQAIAFLKARDVRDKDISFTVIGQVVVAASLNLYGTMSVASDNAHRIPVDFFSMTNLRVQYLTSLQGCPEKVGNFTIDNCEWLDSLEFCPQMVQGQFKITHKNGITELKGFPRIINTDDYGTGVQLDCPKLSGFKGIHKFGKRSSGDFVMTGENLKSYFLGLLKLQDIDGMYAANTGRCPEVLTDVIKHLMDHYVKDGSGDILDAKEDLMQRGYKEYAKI